jgi:hypothetical protein
MFDITSVREIHYGSDEVVYIYQDHTQKNLWYMVPVPTLRKVKGAPAFSLTKYTKDGGGIAGLCTFEMELIQPERARIAAEQQLGGNISWGGFTWVGGTAFFYFDIEGQTEVLAVEPTLYGTNVASFQIPLGTAAAVNTFINAYSKGGGASPFRIEYDMQALTNLLGAKATVKYRAEAAIEYQKTYKTVRDTWGHQKQVLQEVKHILQQSGAGEVRVELGAGSTPELEQRVRDWGWATLEQQVASTVALASAMATGPDAVSATTSFEQSFIEDTVIDWSTPVSRFMDKFSTNEWGQLYTEVDNRKLAVNFNLIGNLTRADTGQAIAKSVTITVTYPTRTTGNTFSLVVTDGAQSTKLYEAPGDFSKGSYNPEYKYHYVILFNDGTSYTSETITTTDTLINITPSNFGTRQVKFIGQHVPFDTAKSVRLIEIDFFFAPPPGSPALVQTKSMTGNGDENAVVFASYYNLPIGPMYTYKLRYLMADNSVITSEPPGAFSNAPNNTNSGNADIVFVVDPKGLFTQFNLRARTVQGGSAFQLVEMNAQYFDTQNSGDKILFQNSWDGWEPSSGLSTAMPPWNFQAVDNANTAYYNLTGSIFYEDGSDFRLDNYKQSSMNKALVLSNVTEFYSAVIHTKAIDWNLVAQVYLTMFQLQPGAASQYSERLPDFFAKPRFDMTAQELDVALGSQDNLALFSVMSPTGEQPVDNLNRYYGIQRLRSKSSVEFFYNARYVLKTGEERTLIDQKVEGELVVVLPPVPPVSKTPGLIRHTVDAKTLAAARQSKKR